MHFMCLYDIRLYDQPTRRCTMHSPYRTKKGNELRASVYVFTLFLFLFRFILFAQRSPYQPATLNKTCNTRIATTALYNQSGYLHVWRYLGTWWRYENICSLVTHIYCIRLMHSGHRVTQVYNDFPLIVVNKFDLNRFSIHFRFKTYK